MTENLLKPGERLDDLQLSGLHIIQHPRAFRFGMDAVLLADFTRLRPRERVADMGNRHRYFAAASQPETAGRPF